MDNERLDYLSQVALWYYEENLDQREIARRMNKSRSMVSRLLTEARDAGLVDVRVRLPMRVDEALSQQLADIFNLTAAVVMGGRTAVPNLAGDLLTIRRLGGLGARALQAHLRPGVTVGIGWGSAVQALVRATPEIDVRDSMVLQFLGSEPGRDSSVDGALLARNLASKLGGDFQAVAGPLIVESAGAAETMKAVTGVRRTLEAAARADVLVSGIGTIDVPLSGLARAGYYTGDHLERLRARGVVGDVMGHLLDIDGNVVDTPENDRVVALTVDDLRQTRAVIAVAGGIAKTRAIVGALRAGVFDEMVIDYETASAVLDVHLGR